ncbi:MAG: chromate efflux transporter [Thermosulfidibacteraceae bacterium]|jgi:chromate transporter
MEENKKKALLFLITDFLKIGLYAYGGPAAVAYIFEHFKTKRKLDENRLKQGLALTQVSPGPIGVNFASFLGYELLGVEGAILAPLFFIIPTTLVVLLLTSIYKVYRNNTIFLKFLSHTYPVIDAIILNASILFIKPYVIKRDFRSLAIGFFSFVALTLLKLHPLYVVVTCGILGLIFFKKTETTKGINNGNTIDKKRILLGLVGISLLTLLILSLRLINENLSEIGIVFYKISSISFGGGFGALPLIIHEVTENKNWLDIKTMMDGIILGSVTPGPVISTSTFIGFLVGGLLGSLVATVYAYFVSVMIFNIVVGLQSYISNSESYQKFIVGATSAFQGLLVFTFFKVSTSTDHSLTNLFIFFVSLILLYYKKASPLIIVLVSSTLIFLGVLLNII